MHVSSLRTVGPAGYVGLVSTSTVLRFNYRLRLGAQAERALMGEWHRSRWIWNQMAAARRDCNRRLINGSDLTTARKQLDWLRAGSQNAQEQTLYTFRGKGKRAFKSKREKPSLGYSRNGFTIKDGRLKVKGISFPVVWHRDLPSEPSSVRIYRDSLGHWYASFVVRVDDVALPEVGGAVGIDWGVSTIATASEPEFDFAAPEHAKAASARLAKYQRRMARKAADNAVGQAKRELISYALRAGRTVVIVPPAYTTMTCSQCWSRAKTALPLSQRTFECWSCGYIDGRDRNAARTILATVERDRASAETVRHDALPSGELQRAS